MVSVSATNKFCTPLLPTTHSNEVKDKVKARDKRGAKLALMRKNAFVKQSEQVDNQILSLENQCMQLENAQTNVIAVQSMEEGLKMQKQIAKNIRKINVLTPSRVF